LFGNTKDCYRGKDLFQYLINNRWREIDAIGIFDFLVEKGVLKPANGKSSGFQKTTNYQWKRYELDENPNGSLKYEANHLVFKLCRASRNLDLSRQNLEIMMQDYCVMAQKFFSDYIKITKDTIAACVNLDLLPMDSLKSIHKHLSVYLETLDPNREVAAIYETEKIGVKPVPTFIPKRPFSEEPLAVFGTPLQEYASYCKSSVPPIIRNCINYLNDTFELQQLHSVKATNNLQLDCWLETYSNLNAVFSLRDLLNSGNCKRSFLRKFPPEVIVGVLKQYLIELPISLCTDDLYDSIKMIYLSKADDLQSNRLSSLRNMLATMPSAHFNTLGFLSLYWHSLVVHLPPGDNRIGALVSLLGPFILRPSVII
jgi:hypothetical protein